MRPLTGSFVIVLAACGSDTDSLASNASGAGKDGGGDTAEASHDGTIDTAVDTSQETSSISCDPGFGFQPDPPETGQINRVSFTHADPLAYVAILAAGPGQAQQGNLEITSSDPWTWTWPTTFDTPGMWTFTFQAGDPLTVYGQCTREVVGTGSPPPLPVGSCDGKVCGESDGQGGTCTACPMEGTCLDPPSPYGPSGPGPWSCLDNAGCQDWGQCRIWCPGEPCDSAVHPDGCPQGVETCFVDPHHASYEDACRACCESRHHAPTGEYACWDEALSLCRYPGDCGKPLLNPP